MGEVIVIQMIDVLKIVLIFLTAWIVSCLIMGYISGWMYLAKSYRLKHPFCDQKWSSQSAYMWWFGFYHSSLSFGSDIEGLYISACELLKIGHPPLFIPWTDISIIEKEGTLVNFIELEFKKSPSKPIRISKDLYQKIVQAKQVGHFEWRKDNF